MARFEFRPGKRESTSCLIGLAGASGSGKTYTALVLALGLAYPDMGPAEIMATIKQEGRSRVCMLDSEGGRALHYAPRPGEEPDFKNSFPFEYADFVPPFTPDSYKEAVGAANDVGFVVVIVDSMSHEYEGEGGILEWADRLEAGVPKPGIENPEGWKKEHWIERPVKPPGQWTLPKRSHKQMVNRFLQCRCHIIFCLRAEEKMKLIKVKKQGTNGEYTETQVIAAEDRPLKDRWEPICEKRFMYEMTMSFIMLPSEPGIPIPVKLEEQHRPFFPEGQRISGASGRALAKWARGDLGQSKPAAAPKPEVTQPESPAAKPEASNEPDPAASQPPAANEEPIQARDWADNYIARVEQCRSLDGLTGLLDECARQREGIKARYPELWARIIEAESRFYQDDQPAAGDGGELFGAD